MEHRYWGQTLLSSKKQTKTNAKLLFSLRFVVVVPIFVCTEHFFLFFLCSIKKSRKKKERSLVQKTAFRLKNISFFAGNCGNSTSRKNNKKRRREEESHDWRIAQTSKPSPLHGRPTATEGGDGDENVPFRSPPPCHVETGDNTPSTRGRPPGSNATEGGSTGNDKRRRSHDRGAAMVDGVSSPRTPRGASDTGSKVMEWVCSKCTFSNAVSMRKCSMCMEGIRPAGMGRSKPLSPRPAGEENRERRRGSQEESAKKKV